MKKLSLLLGTLGGAMAGYVFSNKKLRQELAGAKDAEHAGKILARHLHHDGKQIGGEVQKLVKSDAVVAKYQQAKHVAQEYGTKWKKDLTSFMQHEKKVAKAFVKQKVGHRSASKKAATKKAGK